ncbi:lysophospholipid acyltransferase family protein [Huintestinicola butyrica]|uniref:lysophospholipid acyltransferase family protein n=1 Tax=Huintestinicola butyrica TaxID=2981728 RepID=UPI003F7E8B91
MNAFVRYTVMGIYKLFYNFKIEGWENVPEKEGVIIASNHRSYADPVILTMPMKRPVTYMAKEELFHNKIFGAFIRFLGAFPVKRGAGDMQVIDDCVDILESGRNVVIFPEGTRSKENKVGRGKTGVALIAAKSGADVLPMGIVFEGPKLHFRSKVTLKIGKLIKSEELDIGDGSPKQLKLIKKRIMDSITELVEGPKPEIASENAGVIVGNTENSADKAE